MSKKWRKAIPGIIAAIIVITVIVSGVLGDNKCDRLLEEESCRVEMVKVTSSEKKLLGGSIEVLTYYDSEVEKFNHQSFIEPVPAGLPIYVRYSQEFPECYQFLWDSIVHFDGHEVKYVHIENEGYRFEVTKIK